jgi:hypothetical protein
MGGSRVEKFEALHCEWNMELISITPGNAEDRIILGILDSPLRYPSNAHLSNSEALEVARQLIAAVELSNTKVK